MSHDFLSKWSENADYLRMLRLIGSLSNLFSESEIPFIHYRITENLFCKYFNAENLSRTDTAYDARLGSLGIGIKTFQLKSATNSSIEKIAEFNALSPELRQLSGRDLALRLAHYRNERMLTANRLYGIDRQVYHVVGRRKNKLTVFNTGYDLVDEQNIRDIVDNAQSLRFKDGRHEYTFNKSKSVLMKRFVLPDEFVDIDIDIIAEPYELLEQLTTERPKEILLRTETRPFILLPLYSLRKAPAGVITNSAGKWVPLKSELNQWNAAGRQRHFNEVYISIPASVRRENPDFFPGNRQPFSLRLPDGRTISAKVCQEDDKALMSNPNKALGEWILRDVLRLPEGELLTMDKLDAAGFDTVAVYRDGELDYSIDVFYSATDEGDGLME